jgi:hypothetical protein
MRALSLQSLEAGAVFPYSTEFGASNRSAVKFSFDIHLNMAPPIGAKVFGKLCILVSYELMKRIQFTSRI